MKLLTIALLSPLLCLGEPTLTSPDQRLYDRVKETLRGQVDLTRRNIHRIGNRTFEVELFIATEADRATVPKVLTKISDWPRWMLPRINERPSGGTYYLKVIDILSNKQNPNDLTLDFELKVPVLHHAGKRSFTFSAEQKDKVFVVRGQTLPDALSIIERCDGFMNIYPADNPTAIWLYLRAEVVVRSKTIYELIPEKMIERESGDRIDRILDNYRNEERKILQPPKALAEKK